MSIEKIKNEIPLIASLIVIIAIGYHLATIKNDIYNNIGILEKKIENINIDTIQLSKNYKAINDSIIVEIQKDLKNKTDSLSIIVNNNSEKIEDLFTARWR